MHFLEQMKKFVEWLQNAEEGKQIITANRIKIKAKVIWFKIATNTKSIVMHLIRTNFAVFNLKLN